MRLTRTLVTSVVGVVACSGSEPQDVLAPGTSVSATPPTGGAAGPEAPPAECPPETEPNGDARRANTLVTSLCGEVGGDDDADFLTFRLPATTRSMAMTYEGRVRIRVRVEGEDTVDITPERPRQAPFVLEAPYLVEIRALDDDEPTRWRLNVQLE